MRDYAELVLELRRHHCDAKEDDTQEVCEECAYNVIVADKSFSGITDVCTCGLMHRAADAIEELLKEVQSRENDCINLTGECATYYARSEELLKEKAKLENSGKLLVAAFERLKSKVPHWISVEERLPERTNPLHARDTYLVRLESGCIKTLFYEYDNSDRCRPGRSPLFSEGWEKTAVPVTHWMPLPEPPKEEHTNA